MKQRFYDGDVKPHPDLRSPFDQLRDRLQKSLLNRYHELYTGVDQHDKIIRVHQQINQI